MADELSMQNRFESFLLEPYTPSTDSSTQCIVLRLELIRLDTRYDPRTVGKDKHATNHQANRTAGVLLVNGYFMSDTIEDYDYGWDENTLKKEIFDFKQSIDPKNKRKHLGRTAIPSGTYYVTLNNSTKFGKDALIVSKQPGTGIITGFDGIRIHAGQNSGFTEGCILIGTSDKNTDNQFTDYDNLPFDRKKLGGSGNARWTPKKLREFIKLHGGMATLTIKRNYPSQSLCDREEQQKDHVKACLGKLKTSRDTIILYHKIQSDGFVSVARRLLNSIEESDIRAQSTSTVFKPFPAAKSGGAGR